MICEQILQQPQKVQMRMISWKQCDQKLLMKSKDRYVLLYLSLKNLSVFKSSISNSLKRYKAVLKSTRLSLLSLLLILCLLYHYNYIIIIIKITVTEIKLIEKKLTQKHTWQEHHGVQHQNKDVNYQYLNINRKISLRALYQQPKPRIEKNKINGCVVIL